ncbi:MAG: hypothetical protein K6G26_00145, partial [Lachnospiraceae bacterium]|nr:hypothetical protein [Lachnospiraceae bacterium]
IKIKAIESGNVEYFKDYIEYVKEGHHYIIDKKTLENESDLSKFNREYADNVKWSYCGKKTGFVQGNNKDEAYILSVDGIEKIDIAKEKVDKLECTNGKSFRNVCLIEDMMYAVTVDSLYIINVKEDRIIEVYEFEQKPMDITDFHMFSNHKGYIIGKFEKNGYGYNRVLWISRDKF